MPAAIDADIKEKAKVVAIQVGYREAARQLDLNENTILTWAHREGWADQVQAAREAVLTKREGQGVKSAAIRSVGEVMARLGEKSKLRAAKSGDSMLKTIEKTKGIAQVSLAQPFTQIVGALDKIHNWSSPAQPNQTFNLNLVGVKLTLAQGERTVGEV